MSLPHFEADCVIVGAGVIGLAIARELAIAGRDVLILEKAAAIGTGASSRNSEVIHAGIYYPQGSLKAECCVAGKWALYDYLEERRINHSRCGKLIVATSAAEFDELQQIADGAAANGVDDLSILDAGDVGKLETELNVEGAILSPSTGVFDSHALMISLLGDAEDRGARIAFETEVLSGASLSDGRTKLQCGGREPCIVASRTFINSAGLGATTLARSIEELDESHIPSLFLAKGNYFAMSGRAPFNHLIYPVPIDGGLGIHLTLDLAGAARFGPDVEWVDAIEYAVDPTRAEKFYEAVRRYWPGLKQGALLPGYAGIRSNIVGPGERSQKTDFQILGPDVHGIQGQVHLFGIESPGLTSCLEIARRVGSLLGRST